MNLKRSLNLPLIALISVLSTPQLSAANESAVFIPKKPLEILRITPNGTDVPAGRQIVLTFNQPVVPVGKMERDAAEIPITITPTAACQWHWLNSSSLACELGDESALTPATRYQIQVRPGIMTESQQTLAKSHQHEFITERPAYYYSEFEKWEAPGLPKIRVNFNQSVTRDSVAKLMFMEKPNKQRVAITVEPPPPDEEESEDSKAEALDSNSSDEIQNSDTWIVSPKQLLPLNTKITLNVAPGLQSSEGPELGIEQETVKTFDTFPTFKFIGVICTTLNDERVLIKPQDRLNKSHKKGLNKSKRCNPLRSVSLRFTSPVMKEVAKANLLVVPDLAGGRSNYDPWENLSNRTNLEQWHDKGQKYHVWLPSPLKAYDEYHLKSGSKAIKDEFGRPLKAPIDIRFLTDHRAPHFVFEHNNSVLEKGVDSEVPIVVTNLKKISLYYHLLTPQGWTAQKRLTLPIPQVRDIAFRMPLGMRDLIPGKTGIVQGYFTTKPDSFYKFGKDSDNNRFFTQITPYHVQAKLGHYNTLVWVTDFATGLPVSGAKISLYRDSYATTAKKSKSLASVVTDDKGIARLPGTKTLDPKLDYAYIYGFDEDARFFIRCEKDQETALLPLDSMFRVRVSELTDYRFYSDMQSKYGHIHTWGTTAQGVYKVGDTVQYKFFVRDQSNKAFVPAPRDAYTLTVTDPKGKVAQEVKNITLSEFGSYHGEFTLPKNAAVGWYDFKLTPNFKNTTWWPLRVLVSDFTPSPFRVQTELNGELFHIGEKVTIGTSATLHAGGPYTDAQTKVNAILSPQSLHPSHPQAKGFWFDVLTDDVKDETVFSIEDKKVDDKGQLQTTFTLSAKSKVLYGKLRVESAVRDDRGKDVANMVTAQYVGRDRFVGLKETSWLLTAGKEAKVLLLVVDDQGNPIADTDINVKVEQRVTKAARVKGAGNAYLTRYEHKWVQVAQCQAKSEKTFGACTFTPAKAGAYKITASIKDSQNRPHSTELQQWATGQDYVLWETAPGHTLEIMPEQETYKVGETARYFVKNPYPGAQALITIERFGTIKSWVQILKGSMEIIEVPVEADYVPGFFVSVTVMSPRVDKPIDKNQVDLGKPAFRMGYVQTNVKEPYKELVVDIKTDKAVYKPREQVTIDLHAYLKNPPKPSFDKGGQEVSQPIELAVTVLDESVFDLLADGRDYFDPYKGFYTLDGLDMANFSLLMRLVGRQKFEKKGANAGGDGGGGTELSTRSLFKYVSYWNPAIKTDAAGQAQIEFTVPDNLTGWRVLVMAVTPGDRMGLGDANFKVNKPIEIRPVLPNQLTSGDSFQAGFSVMNRTAKVRDLNLTLEANGPVVLINKEASSQGIIGGFLESFQSLLGTEEKPINEPFSTSATVKAQPYKRYIQWLPIKTTGAGTIQFTSKATDGVEQDALEKTLQVLPHRPSITAATYGTTTSNEVNISVQFPTDIHTDVGGLSVIASPTVISDVDGAFKYMRDYPYACWEQKLSKGAMASHYNNLRAYLPESITWEGSLSLPKEIINLAKEYQAPNGGMAYFVAQDKRVSPYLSAYTALVFNWLRENYQIPETVENKLHDYLLTLLRKNVMPEFYSKGMASSVRAVALAALAEQGKITRQDIKRYQRHVKRMDLFGQSQFLAAALQVPGTGRIRTKVVDMILAHANQTSGKVSFTETLDSGYKRMLSSSLRTQCAILQSLSQYNATMKQSNVGDIPFKLVRHIMQTRKNRGHWENTQENMFCMNALIEYARVYEKTTPLMTVQSWLNEEQIPLEKEETPLEKEETSATFDDVKNPPVTFTHKMTDSDPGQKGVVKLEREGQGRLYYTVRMTYSEKAEKATAINAGIEVNREYHVERDGKWILLESPMKMKTGELVRIDLYLSLPAPRHFVVVDDPVPGGLEPVNRDLATTSQIDADKAQGQYVGGSLWFSHDDWKEYGLSWWNF